MRDRIPGFRTYMNLRMRGGGVFAETTLMSSLSNLELGGVLGS